MFDVQIRDGVAVVTLRHGKANALDIEICDALRQQFGKFRGSDVRAVVITGEGRIFSAGVDLLRAADGGPRYLEAFVPVLNELYRSIFFFPKPVVAAINGHAIAGGCVLACCADYRVLAENSGRMGVTELLVGLPFPAFAFEVLRFTTAPLHFPKFTASGETFDTGGALACGFADEAVPAGELMPRALAAQALAAIRPEAFAVNKLHTRRPVQDWLDTHAAKLEAEVMKVWLAPDTTASIRGYAARTFKKP